ncbi:hypothetical protein CBOM_05656 [Ceraceosorus bombacis]|uniref:Uncharacterized protein n=1 Tax=Ceraceosorus bombacis TaxID=401625 RepID=A0A0P1BS14_9BASI|nr:hypothetical protein CBOM_05656 [Ceraceosorus bombacis]
MSSAAFSFYGILGNSPLRCYSSDGCTASPQILPGAATLRQALIRQSKGTESLGPYACCRRIEAVLISGDFILTVTSLTVTSLTITTFACIFLLFALSFDRAKGP